MNLTGCKMGSLSFMLHACLKVLLSLSMLFTLSCSSRGKLEQKNDDYLADLKSLTRSTDQYSGLYQTFQADITFLNTALQTTMVQRQAEFMQWDEKKTQQERERAFQSMAAQTKFFMRFYTPESEYDDFTKGNSMWKIYLEQNGLRHEGKVKKVDRVSEVQSLYPHSDRFSTPYEVTFNVPTAATESSGAKVTLTSSLGKAEFTFSAGK